MCIRDSCTTVEFYYARNATDDQGSYRPVNNNGIGSSSLLDVIVDGVKYSVTMPDNENTDNITKLSLRAVIYGPKFDSPKLHKNLTRWRN